MTLHSHLVLSWSDVHRDTERLAMELTRRGPWRGIVAIARGGLVPAALLARELDLRLVETLCLASYDGRNKGPLRVLKGPDVGIGDGGAGWLLVDDLVDSGATLRLARRMLPGAFATVLCAKPEGRPDASLWVREVDRDVWIDFPWEQRHANS